MEVVPEITIEVAVSVAVVGDTEVEVTVVVYPEINVEV